MEPSTQQPLSDVDVVHDEEGHRYLLRSDGEHVGVIDYRPTGDTLDLHHTEVRNDLRGRGLAAILVRGALEDVRDSDRKVIPSCWYVRQFIDSNPQFSELVTSRS